VTVQLSVQFENTEYNKNRSVTFSRFIDKHFPGIHQKYW